MPAQRDLPISAKLREGNKLHKTAANIIERSYLLINAHIAIMPPCERKKDFEHLLEWMRKEPPNEA